MSLAMFLLIMFFAYVGPLAFFIFKGKKATYTDSIWDHIASLWGLLGLIIAPLLVLFISHMTIGVFPGYGKGEIQNAKVLEVSYEGIFYKTYEVTLVTGERGEGKTYNVSTDDPKIADMLKQKNQRFNIKYNEWAISPAQKGSSTNIISQVKPLE